MMYEERESLAKKSYLTVDEAVEHAGFGLAQIKYMAAACVVFFTEVQFIHMGGLSLPSINCEWDLKKRHILLLLLSGSVGGTMGAFVGGSASDKYGRKKNVIRGLFFMIVFSFLSVTQNNFYVYLSLRACSFFFLHFVKPSALCMILEISPRKTRFVAKMVLATAGQLGATCSSLLAMVYLNTIGWRELSLYLLLPCFVPLLIYYFLEDSPRYLFLSGHKEDGCRAMQKIFKHNGKKDLSHLIRNMKDERRGNFEEMFTPEFKTTTLVILALIAVKNLVITTLHTAMPYILQGDAGCHYEVASKNSTDTCQGLSSGTLYSLTKAHGIGIAVTISALSFSQIIGRKPSSMTCFFLASGTLISNIWCQGKEAFIYKVSLTSSLIHGGTAILHLFIQEVYPTSIRAMTTGFFFALGHLISTAAPYIVVYVVLGHEFYIFVIGGPLFALCGFLLLQVRHESKNAPLEETSRPCAIEPDMDWELELDYSSD